MSPIMTVSLSHRAATRFDESVISFKPWFEFLFFELKALGGGVSKGPLQSSTAMRISLDVISHLARSAYAADPAHFMPPDEEMACVWSIRSCGVDVEVWVMA